VDDDDAAALQEVRLRALETDPLAYMSTYARESQWDDDLWQQWATTHAQGSSFATFLAFGERSRTAVGMIMVAELDEAAGEYGVFALWVAPEAREQGLGGALVATAVEWARGVGAATLQLSVTEEAAGRLYAAAGFAFDGRERPLYHAPEVRERGMTLVLQPVLSTDAHESGLVARRRPTRT
jgi:GNAT superfamily N-acetyltransferase